MALTRRALKAMGIDDEKIDEIIAMHTETVDGLKADITKYKAEADALPDVQKQLERAQNDLAASKKDSWKVKYEAIKEEFDEFKGEQEKKETRTAKEAAYRQLLRDVGISEKRVEAVLKVSDVDSAELDSKGGIKGADKLKESLKEEWSDFIVTITTKGTDTSNPPANGGATLSKEDIFKIKDPVERQNAIGENLELFRKE